MLIPMMSTGMTPDTMNKNCRFYNSLNYTRMKITDMTHLHYMIHHNIVYRCMYMLYRMNNLH